MSEECIDIVTRRMSWRMAQRMVRRMALSLDTHIAILVKQPEVLFSTASHMFEASLYYY